MNNHIFQNTTCNYRKAKGKVVNDNLTCKIKFVMITSPQRDNDLGQGITVGTKPSPILHRSYQTPSLYDYKFQFPPICSQTTPWS